MRLVSLNIWEGLVEKPFLDFVESEKNKADIFCFQEASENIRKEIKNILGDWELVTAYKYLLDVELRFFVSSFVKNNLKILKSGILLDKEAGTGLAVYTQIQEENKIFNVINIHGISEPGDKLDNEGRLKQSKIIIDFLKDVEGFKIVTGDFNLEFDTKSVLMFEENGYRNLIKEYKIDTTRNEISWKNYPNNKQYYADFMFISKDLKVLNFDVPKNEVSDHLPMIIEVE